MPLLKKKSRRLKLKALKNRKKPGLKTFSTKKQRNQQPYDFIFL
jgi:hypothetical protein